MIATWDKDKGNYRRKIHRGKRYSIFNFSFFIAATYTAIIILAIHVSGIDITRLARIPMPGKARNFSACDGPWKHEQSMPLVDAASPSIRVDGDCSIATQSSFSLRSAAIADPHSFIALACASPSAQASLNNSSQTSAAGFQYKTSAGSELAAQHNPTPPTDYHLAKDGRKEVGPAASRGGNSRVSRSRSAIQMPEVRSQESEKEIILGAAKRNGLSASQTAILFAIRKAENGKAGREFGVLHPKAVDTDLATQAGWAAATIKKNALRFSKEVRSQKSGVRSKEFIHYLADRYCPPSVDPDGNRNWKKNVCEIVNCRF